MLLCVFVAFFGLLLAAIATLVSWVLLQKSRQAEFVVPPAVESDAEFLPLAAPISHFTVSVEVPFPHLQRAILNGEMPGGENVRIGGYEVSWGLAGTSATVRRAGTDLLVEGRIGGKLKVDEGVPFLLELLGTTFELDLGYSVRTGLWLREDWSLDTVSSVQTTVHKALKPAVLPIFEVDLRDQIAPHADAAIQEAVKAFERTWGPGGALEAGARTAWASLCTSFPLFPETNTWVEITPSRPRAAPLRVDADAIRLQVRLDVSTRIAAHPTRPSCPFPERLVLEDEQPAGAQFSVPIYFDYETLRFAINQALEGAPRIGPIRLHEVERIEKRGSHLLVTVTFVDDLTADLKGLSVVDEGLAGMRNTAHVLAEVRQDHETQRIALSDVRIDTEAPDFLTNALLEAAEPWIAERIEKLGILDPSAFRRSVEGALNHTLRPAGIHIGLDEFSVTGLEPGPEHVRGLVTASGTVDVSVPAALLTPSALSD